MIQAAVFCLSLSTLAYEVLLARIFAITQWNHLSFMVISLALFGFAASGTVLSLIEARIPGWHARYAKPSGFVLLIVLYTGAALSAFLTLLRLPLDYFLLPIEPVQGVYLLLSYLILALPFFFAGSAISIAYSGFPDRIRLTYFTTMSGSALGALMPYPLLNLFEEGQLLVVIACIPVLIILPLDALRRSTKGDRFHRGHVSMMTAGVVITALAAALIFWRQGVLVETIPSDYKSLSHTLRFPDTRLDWSGGNIRGRIDRVESPYTRFAPGLSLTYTGQLPLQTALFRDADSRAVLYGRSKRAGLEFARWTHAFAGYHLVGRPEKVLIVQKGGGLGIACALSAEAGHITVLEPHPLSARWMREHYGLEVQETHARAFLAGSKNRYDVIHVETWGPSIPGAGALDQSFSLTTQAMTDYITHLTDDGMLVVSGRLRLPPADMVRLWAAARQGLLGAGNAEPEQHLAVIRNWDTFTLLVAGNPINDKESLVRFAQQLNFDIVYLDGFSPDLVNRYNIFDAPFHHNALLRLASAYRTGTEQHFFSEYLLDVAPQSDNRPFPNRFLRWDRISSIYRSFGERLYTLLLSGEVVIVVVLIEAAAVAALLMGLPLIFTRRSGSRISLSGMLYFLGVGAGFMLTEMALIYQLVMIYGDPIISMTVVLAGLLVLSGIGGMLSEKLPGTAIPYVLLVLTGVLSVLAAGSEWIFQGILALPEGIRQAAAVGVMVPVGLILGLPFPMGMRYLLGNPLERAYGWAANGCASVIGAIVAVQIVNWHDKRDQPEEIREVLVETAPDIVGVSILHGNRWGGIDIARMVKSIDGRTAVVFGGIGITFLWKLLLDNIPEIDYAVIGEGELPFSKLVHCLERNAIEEIPEIPGLALRIDGRPIRTSPKQVPQELDTLPDPAGNFAFQHVVSSRGCPGNCTFCGSPEFWGRKVRFHSSEYFVNQLERLHRNGVNFFYISDDTFTFRSERVVEICRAIIERNLPITWAAISRVDAVSETMLKWMRRAGCIQISFGVESGSKKIRQRLNKTVRMDQVRSAFAVTRRMGIMARAYFIYGCPGETDDTIADTLDLIREIQPLSAIFYILDIFPGTALYCDFKRRTGASDDIWMERVEDILYFQTDPALDQEKILSWGKTLRREFFQRLPDFAEAIDLIDDPDLYPFHADFLSRMGMTFSHGDYAQHPDIPRKEQTAEHLFRRALAYAPVHRAYLGLGILLQKRGAATESVELLCEAAERYPESDDLHTCLGISYMNLGQFRDALSSFDNLSDSEPAATYISECHRKLKK